MSLVVRDEELILDIDAMLGFFDEVDVGGVDGGLDDVFRKADGPETGGAEDLAATTAGLFGCVDGDELGSVEGNELVGALFLLGLFGLALSFLPLLPGHVLLDELRQNDPLCGLTAFYPEDPLQTRLPATQLSSTPFTFWRFSPSPA
jgi:hypothetical protein